MMKLKLILISLVIMSFSSDKFPTITGNFKKRGIEFNYSSNSEFRDSRYYVKNYINCNSREPICLSWPVAGILCDNNEPLKTETFKEIQVMYPYLCRVATIYLGANLKDPVDDIHCYYDESKIKLSAETYKTKINFLSELGESMNVIVTSTYINQLKTSTIEIDVEGGSGILVERIKNLNPENNFQKQDWSITFADSLKRLFEGSKHLDQLAEFLRPSKAQKTFFNCIKGNNSNSSNLIFSSTGMNNSSEDILFCLFSESKKQNIAFTAKCFISN